MCPDLPAGFKFHTSALTRTPQDRNAQRSVNNLAFVAAEDRKLFRTPIMESDRFDLTHGMANAPGVEVIKTVSRWSERQTGE